jgi:hypothetical protein
MDYVEQELRRQQRLWQTLLGSASPEKADDGAAFDTARQNDAVTDDAGTAGGGDSKTPERPSGLTARAAGIPDPSEDADAPRTALSPLRSALRRESALRRSAAEDTTAILRVISPSSGETVSASARALSRAVERDVRRYDGGFTLY